MHMPLWRCNTKVTHPIRFGGTNHHKKFTQHWKRHCTCFKINSTFHGARTLLLLFGTNWFGVYVNCELMMEQQSFRFIVVYSFIVYWKCFYSHYHLVDHQIEIYCTIILSLFPPLDVERARDRPIFICILTYADNNNCCCDVVHLQNKSIIEYLFHYIGGDIQGYTTAL